MNTDTPETDKLMDDYGGGCPHPLEAVDLARRLERERDEARRLTEQWRAAAMGAPVNLSLIQPLPWEPAKSLCEHGVRDLKTNLPYCRKCDSSENTTNNQP